MKNIDLLFKPLWTNKDIATYCGVGLNVAGNIRQIAINKYDGLVPFDSKKVKRDSVLRVISTELICEKLLITALANELITNKQN